MCVCSAVKWVHSICDLGERNLLNMSDDYESVCLMKPEVFVYRIPPLANNRGHKAADWNLDDPNWVGRMRLIAIGKKLELRLEDKSSGQLFAKAPIDEYPGICIEPVIDSSRYFVVRLKNDNGQTAFIGMGFGDRGDSFDLNVALQDHFKYIEKSSELEKEDATAAEKPKLDLGFKEGQTITLTLGKKGSSAPRQRPATSASTATGGIPLLPPPPPGRNRMVGASVTAVARLKKDYSKLLRDPVPYVLAAPLHSNILEWHYVIRGAPSTPYEGGIYHGKLIFPPDFPFKPPAIYMLTPSGRFQTNTRLCLSISDFHPDTWNPAWTVCFFCGIYHGKLIFPPDFPFKPPAIYMLTPSGRFQTNTRLCLSISDFHPDTWNPAWTIITGLLSFMNETVPTLGSVTSTDAEKRTLAKKSREFNLKDRVFCDLFEDLANEIRTELAEERNRGTADEAAMQEMNSSRRSGEEGDYSALTYNLVVVAGVVIIAFAVRYVILAAQEEN
ncbi:Adaptin ear-binding coat-associated protein 2 [Toxocara canis]|uniref:Adaptin ear-binding coat-associated protein 2 n=1 Tax=Toxocara canis TaxID=6265 RepID=A0A0B2VRJ3_TOXCA|nr:Adaptin ear-binding coat-associated protein 2 [Toxocara canis]